MTVIGFSFSKISANRSKPVKGQLKINRRCTPNGVEEVSLGGDRKALKYSFDFEADYEPGIANISFAGHLVELVSSEEHENVLSTWNESKKFPPASFERVLNAILDRCHTEALLMAKELDIPPPFKLPGVKVKQKEE